MRELQSISISKHAEAEQTDRMISSGSGHRPPRGRGAHGEWGEWGGAGAAFGRTRKYDLMK